MRQLRSGEGTAFIRPAKVVDKPDELGTGVFLEVKKNGPILLMFLFRPEEGVVCQKSSSIFCSRIASLKTLSTSSFKVPQHILRVSRHNNVTVNYIDSSHIMRINENSAIVKTVKSAV